MMFFKVEGVLAVVSENEDSRRAHRENVCKVAVKSDEFNNKHCKNSFYFMSGSSDGIVTICYAIPDSLNNIADVERAIELATQDLKNKYDIDICDNTQSNVSDEDPQATKLHVAEQLRLFDILPLISQEPPRWVA